MARMSLKRLSDFSRQLGTMLEAGLTLRRGLAILEKGARSRQRDLYHRLGVAIEQGDTFSEAMEKEKNVFPSLFLQMTKVGETAGGLDKVLKRLADYYEFIRSMWHRLLMRLLYPLFQYWALIFILAGVAYLTRVLAQPPRPNAGWVALAVLGTGVVIFLAPIIGYFVATRMLGGLRAVHEALIRLPVLGGVMRALALARFSWSMELMTGAGVSIYDALIWSLQATANHAYAGRAASIVERIKDGVPLHASLTQSGLFPDDYLEMVHVAEESGTMPETFGRLAKIYLEKSDSAIRALTSALSWLVWIGVACVIVFYIFRFASAYIGAIQGFQAE